MAAQKDVSLTNNEQVSTSYGIVNIDAQYYINNKLTLRVGVDNLLDKEYQNHLGGYNRVKESDNSGKGAFTFRGGQCLG